MKKLEDIKNSISGFAWSALSVVPSLFGATCATELSILSYDAFSRYTPNIAEGIAYELTAFVCGAASVYAGKNAIEYIRWELKNKREE